MTLLEWGLLAGVVALLAGPFLTLRVLARRGARRRDAATAESTPKTGDGRDPMD